MNDVFSVSRHSKNLSSKGDKSYFLKRVDILLRLISITEKCCQKRLF